MHISYKKIYKGTLGDMSGFIVDKNNLKIFLIIGRTVFESLVHAMEKIREPEE